MPDSFDVYTIDARDDFSPQQQAEEIRELLAHFIQAHPDLKPEDVALFASAAGRLRELSK